MTAGAGVGARGAGGDVAGRPGARVVGARLAGRRGGTARGDGGGVYVSEVQRSRVLNSALALIAEEGYGRMSVARVTGRARVSRRTFYDLFEDREDCLLAAFGEALQRIAVLTGGAYSDQARWVDGVRAGLTAMLELFDAEPAVCSLVVVNVLGAGPRVMECRSQALDRVRDVVDRGRLQTRAGREVPPLTADGVVGAVFSVIHAHVCERRSGRLTDLRNALMAMIVLPYLGRAAAQRELERPVPVSKPVRRGAAKGAIGQAGDPLEGLSMRLTYRTLRTLEVIAESPGASNRVIADSSGVSDQGQMSRLLARLEGLGLIRNTGVSQPSGDPNAWRLTPRGEQVRQTVIPRASTNTTSEGSSPPHRPKGMNQ
jgi:AcrR family transcriptional regulator/DNA-binding MarR family transcriptional regulator